MANTKIGMITIKGAANRDSLAGGETAKALKRARKSNSAIRSATLDAELAAIELAMRK